MNLQERLDIVQDKIVAGLAKSGSAPNLISLGMRFSEWLDDDDFDTLSALEQQDGQDDANEWMATVLVDSGYYRDAGNGEIIAIER